MNDNEWIERVGELRQMVDDVWTPGLTADDVTYYINEWGITDEDEQRVIRNEFDRHDEAQQPQ